jgi:osmotically-inducible protein OsmY
MKVIIALVAGLAIGAAIVWFLMVPPGSHAPGRGTGAQLENTAKNAGDALQEKLKAWHLRPQDLKEELSAGGQIVRRKAQQASQSLADATADARITAAIKAKLLARRDLSALSVSVNTTSGVVTVSGMVSSPEEVSKILVLAMETEGVREVISTLQLAKPKPAHG